jgi:hypothetical protein
VFQFLNNIRYLQSKGLEDFVKKVFAAQKNGKYSKKRLHKNSVQRVGLYAGWELEFRLPITAAD